MKFHSVVVKVSATYKYVLSFAFGGREFEPDSKPLFVSFFLCSMTANKLSKNKHFYNII